MMLHFKLTGATLATLQPVTVHLGQIVINAQVSGMFGGPAQLVLSEKEAEGLEQDLTRQLAALRSARAATG